MLTKQQKIELVQKLREKLKESTLTVVCNFESLSVERQKDLKKKIKNEGGEALVVKRRLFQRALSEEKINFPEITGPVIILFGKDEVLPAKVVYQFSKTLTKKEKLEFIGGVNKKEGKSGDKQYFVLSKEELIEIASLPSREELLGRLIGTISAPLSNFVNVLQGNIKGLIQVLAKAKT